jgi:hypothetical protein
MSRRPASVIGSRLEARLNLPQHRPIAYSYVGRRFAGLFVTSIIGNRHALCPGSRNQIIAHTTGKTIRSDGLVQQQRDRAAQSDFRRSKGPGKTRWLVAAVDDFLIESQRGR